MAMLDKTDLYNALEALRSMTGNDFAGAAAINPALREGRWIAAAGSRGERHKQMVIKPGRGLAGMVMLTGRAITAVRGDSLIVQGRPECPLMLAEGLLSAAALPLRHEGQLTGVLLAGTRTDRSPSELLRGLELTCGPLAALLQVAPVIQPVRESH